MTTVSPPQIKTTKPYMFAKKKLFSGARFFPRLFPAADTPPMSASDLGVACTRLYLSCAARLFPQVRCVAVAAGKSRGNDRVAGESRV